MVETVLSFLLDRSWSSRQRGEGFVFLFLSA